MVAHDILKAKNKGMKEELTLDDYKHCVEVNDQ